MKSRSPSKKKSDLISLWHAIRKYADQIETDTIEEIIGHDCIEKNIVLINEVKSLYEILQELRRQNNPEENELMPKRRLLQNWEHVPITKHVRGMLLALGEEGIQILEETSDKVKKYFCETVERKNIANVRQYEEFPTRSKLPQYLCSEREKLLRKISNHMTVFEIFDIKNIIHEAFYDEERELSREANRLRLQIDKEIKRQQQTTDTDVIPIEDLQEIFEKMEELIRHKVRIE